MRLDTLLRPGAAAEDLGRRCVARRVSGGTVPEGCYGLRVREDGVTERFPQGERLRAVKHSALYWVHPGPYTLRLAPDDAAPEVGIRLSVAVNFERAGILDERFADYIGKVRKDDDFTIAALETDVRSCLSAFALPPCAQPHEIDTLRAEFSNALQSQFGLVCAKLEKIDLREEVDLARWLLEQEKGIVADASAAEAGERGVMPISAVATREEQARFSAARSALPSLREVARNDELVGRRLFLDLPRAAWRMRQVTDFPQGEGFAQFRDLIARIDQAHRRVALLPALKPGLRTTTPGTHSIRSRAAETQRAADSLSELWALILQIEAIPKAVASSNIDALDRVVTNLECAIAQRFGAAGSQPA